MKVQNPVVGIGSVVDGNRVTSIDGRWQNINLVNESGVVSVMSFQEVEKFYEQQRKQEQPTT
ncbi:MAG: hypothetical protein ACK6DA_03415 [Candidatus Kapaibacterium sp.]|jgi:hypothetical protein